MKKSVTKYLAVILILLVVFGTVNSSTTLAASAPTPVGPLPSTNQLAWQEMGLTAFAHFGINTFTGNEWGLGTENPSLFNPTAFDAGQWVSVLKNAGFKMIILTVKHHDGFCLWPSNYTTHDVASSPWKNGQGDIVKEVADACHASGMKFGFYLSPWDRHESTYGTGSAYNTYYSNQLRELLTNYGEVSEVWFDGAHGDDGKYQEYATETWIDMIHLLQPNAVIFGGGDLRWEGNETGATSDPCWSIVNAAGTPNPEGIQWKPAECDVSIRPGWFYKSWEDNQLKSVEQLANIYKNSTGINAQLLLNISPDTRGLIPDVDITRLNEFKAYLDASFTNDLAQGAQATVTDSRGAGFEADKVLDNNTETYWAASDGVTEATLTLDFGSAKYFDMVELQEPVQLGQRITGYNLEAWNGTSWVSLATKQCIGIKHIIQFAPITASKVRINITNSRACPAIRTMKVFKENGGQVQQEYPNLCNGGIAYASSENPPNETAAKAFDNQTIWSKWMALTGTGWIDYDFAGSSAYAVNRYTLTSADDMPERDPRNWTLKGSNDGIHWTVLDTRSNESFSSRNQTRSFSYSNSNTYTVYRLDISANHGGTELQLAEIQLFGGYISPTSPIDRCTGGTITASGEQAPVEGRDKAFDNNTATKWYAYGSTPWIQYDFAGPSAYSINSYKITSANDEPSRDPRNWTLQGSNDGINWIIVDTRNDITFGSRLQTKTFSFDNSTNYQMYRMNISANNGANDTQIAEIEMFND